MPKESLNGKRVALDLRGGTGKSKLLLDSQEPGWLSGPEVMQILQVSERQVQRFQTEQALSNLAYLERAGKKPQTLYRVDEVMEIKKDLDRKRKARDENALVTKAAHERVRTLQAARRGERLNIPADFSTGKSRAFEALVHAILAHQQTAGGPIGIREKMLLTIDEAQQFGFPREFLYGAVHAKRLQNFGGPGRFLLSRAELNKLAKGDCLEERVHGALSDEEREAMRKAS